MSVRTLDSPAKTSTGTSTLDRSRATRDADHAVPVDQRRVPGRSRGMGGADLAVERRGRVGRREHGVAGGASPGGHQEARRGADAGGLRRQDTTP
jgi:hypothetical protein